MPSVTSSYAGSDLSDKLEQTIPLDKSWVMRLGVLDLAAESATTIDFLSKQQGELSDDLAALLRSSKQWFNGEDIEVGESGTLYRFLQALAWSKGEKKTFITSGTLSGRSITNDSKLLQRPLQDLLQLDGGTSQWASAAILFTEATTEGLTRIPYKLALSVEAKTHWLDKRPKDEPWEARKDATIYAQAVAYLNYLKTGQISFKPVQAEDFCFALAYDLMTVEEGARRWPQLSGHESNRLTSVTESIKQMQRGELITVADHRVVQAMVMRFGLEKSRFAKPGCVAKTWPLFWEFISRGSTITT